MKWQPIETASRTENERMLLWAAPFDMCEGVLGRARIFSGYWCLMGNGWVAECQGYAVGGIEAFQLVPTHWMPLPPAPSNTEGQL
jgi:hypothetical protein